MEDMMDTAIDVLQDAFFDTLYLIPFLLVTYLFMEWLEHKTGEKTQNAIRKAGPAGPIVGAVLGVVPQCGFSAAASTLFAGRVIGLGTLIAVFLSTSDEMLPIFIAEQVPIETILGILGIKMAIGMAFGLVINLAVRLTHRPEEGLRIHELCERDHCDCSDDCATCKDNPALAYEHHDDCGEGCDHGHHHHDHSHDAGWKGIVLSAVKHTAQVTLFVFLISLVINALFEIVGEDTIAAVLNANELLAVVASAIVGLIPNCAASVAIAQLYVEGVLSFGATMAGLLSAAGVGLLVLLRTNRPAKQNLFIVVLLVGISVLCGFAFQITGFSL